MLETISNIVDAPAGVVDTSFAAFLRTAAGQGACGEELLARLMPSAGTINSLRALMSFAKERWPGEHGPQDWRQPPSIANAPFGSLRMKQIWAAYLKWREAL